MNPGDFERKVIEWRQKAVKGELTREEMKEALQVLRDRRLSAGAASAKAKTKTNSKTKSAPIDTDALLSELGDVGL